MPAAFRFPPDWQPKDQPYACLEVSDTGEGIAAADLGKIFEPFFSRKFTGRGLGLAVALGIVKAHRGGITVASAPGQGSSFCVFFPSSNELAIPRLPAPAARVTSSQGGAALLVVEDEDVVRIMTGAMLTRLGYTVFEARDGVEAVEVFKQHPSEIMGVLCDLVMPRMNGWDTLNALRAMAPGLPVILASGYDEDQVMAGEHPELPQVCLGKPYQMQQLRAALDRALKPGAAARSG